MSLLSATPSALQKALRPSKCCTTIPFIVHSTSRLSCHLTSSSQNLGVLRVTCKRTLSSRSFSSSSERARRRTLMAAEKAQGSLEAVNDAASRAAQSASNTSSSALDRLSHWYSENKVLAWTIVGVAVAGTGAAIYASSSSRPEQADSKDRKSKKERRKEKEAAREATTSTDDKAGKG